jgi:hypothetical protein
MNRHFLAVFSAAALAIAATATTASAAPAPGYSLGDSSQTLAGWRSTVGHGAITRDRQHKLSVIAQAVIRPTKATILRETVIGGSKGPAIYLDLVSPNPLWTLRHADALVRVLSKSPFSGGWAIRLRNAFHNTVWIAGSAGNTGFVGSANSTIDNASPVKHSEPVVFP